MRQTGFILSIIIGLVFSVVACEESVTDSESDLNITFVLQPEKTTVAPNEDVTLTYTSDDPVIKDLSVEWLADAGTIQGTNTSATWTAPDTEGDYQIVANVYDTRGLGKSAGAMQSAGDPVATESVTMTVSSDTVYVTQTDTVTVTDTVATPQQIVIVTGETGISIPYIFRMSTYGQPIPEILAVSLNGNRYEDYTNGFSVSSDGQSARLNVYTDILASQDSAKLAIETSQGIVETTILIPRMPTIIAASNDTLSNTPSPLVYDIEYTGQWLGVGRSNLFYVEGEPVETTSTTHYYDGFQFYDGYIEDHVWIQNEQFVVPSEFAGYYGWIIPSMFSYTGVELKPGTEPNMSGDGIGYFTWMARYDNTYTRTNTCRGPIVYGERDYLIDIGGAPLSKHTFDPLPDYMDTMRDLFVPAHLR